METLEDGANNELLDLNQIANTITLLQKINPDLTFQDLNIAFAYIKDNDFTRGIRSLRTFGQYRVGNEIIDPPIPTVLSYLGEFTKRGYPYNNRSGKQPFNFGPKSAEKLLPIFQTLGWESSYVSFMAGQRRSR